MKETWEEIKEAFKTDRDFQILVFITLGFIFGIFIPGIWFLVRNH